ncbi:MAG: hypothetical protein Kow0013_30310 [Pararhodobacter sp.]
MADVAGIPLIGVTRAHARGRTVFTGCPAISATDAFSDELCRWLSDRCIRDPEAFTPTMTLFRDWRAWAGERGIRSGSVKRFSPGVAGLGFEKFNTGRQRGYLGLATVSHADDSGCSGAISETCDSRPVERTPCILALDLGTTTGWALRGFDTLITSGSVSFRPGRFDGGGMRYLRFTNWLSEIDRLSGPIAAIWFEEVRRHAGTDAAHVYGGLMATLTAWAELRGVPYEGVPVGTIKKHATGRGNAPKQAMIAAVRARGFSPADDNEADAIALLLWAIETKGGLA